MSVSKNPCLYPVVLLVMPRVHVFHTSHGSKYDSGSTSRPMVVQQHRDNNRSLLERHAVLVCGIAVQVGTPNTGTQLNLGLGPKGTRVLQHPPVVHKIRSPTSTQQFRPVATGHARGRT